MFVCPWGWFPVGLSSLYYSQLDHSCECVLIVFGVLLLSKGAIFGCTCSVLDYCTILNNTAQKPVPDKLVTWCGRPPIERVPHLTSHLQ